jgi:hypothetical protein
MLAKLFTFRCKDKAIYFINQTNPQKNRKKFFVCGKGGRLLFKSLLLV